jgi:tetratricopeptide (TPR) repeat protein
MSTWKQTRVLVLAVTLAALTAALYAQGIGWTFGAPPSPFQTEHQSEEGWIVTEIVRDITEMSTYAVDASAKTSSVKTEQVRPGVYRIAANAVLKSDLEVDLTARVWDPDQFAALARASLTRARLSRTPSPSPAVHKRLVELTPLRLTRASAEISAALATRMTDPSLHESAALTVGAFAMRESARRFDDVRWSLNRMTAHLAMARALRGSSTPSLDGRIAEAVFLTLANHQAKAMTAIEQIEQSEDAVAALPWTRALRLRMTQDWVLLAEPSTATLLEKFEYLRARRSAARGARSVGDFNLLDVDPSTSADWIRILQANGYGVEEGSFFSRDLGLQLEQQEAIDVFNTFPKNPTDLKAPNLNARASRCITDGKPQIISWGAWAEFSQRHLAMLVGTIDTYWRLRFGDSKAGAAAGQEMELALKDLTMFPVATTLRRTGTANGDADMTRIAAAIGVGLASPERLTIPVWSWLEESSRYERIKKGMPPKVQWFARASARMPYGGAWRTSEGGQILNGAELIALTAEAPYDFFLRVTELKGRFGDRVPAAQIQSAFGRRLAYDLRAIDYAEARFESADALPLLEYACGISPNHCVALARTLARLGRTDEAARQYEAAFADPAYDRVSFSQNCGWLVSYYLEHNQANRAFIVAEEAAQIGAWGGLNTLAYLHERLEHWDEAEHFYREAYQRYDANASELLGFYYRAFVVGKQARFERAWAEVLPTVFPDGLRDIPKAFTGTPEHGVIITEDNLRVVKAGFQSGDIIVGLEGFRIENLKQYRAVNAFFLNHNEIKLSLWRGSVFNKTYTAPNRMMGIGIRSYPIQDWAEE